MSRRITSIFSLVSVVSFSFMALILTVSVVARYVLNRPLVGVEDLTEQALLLTVYFALAEATSRRQHIRVTLLMDHLGGRVRNWLECMGNGCVLLVGGLITYRLLLRAFGLAIGHHLPEFTMNLQIPIWPFMGLACLGLLGLILETLKAFIQKTHDKDHGVV